MEGRIVSILLLLTAVCGCAQGTPQSQSEAAGVDSPGDKPFVNPEFDCATSDVVEPGDGYPHPMQNHPSPRGPRTVAELQDFCARMGTRFADSRLMVSEARRVYEAIPSILNISDEPYGIPSDDEPAIPVDLESRVMLRKTAENEYELFFFRIGCGRHYSLYELDLTTSPGKARKIESWSENFPC